VVLVSPSDHIVRPIVAFEQAAMRAAELAGTGSMVTFGVKPLRPETGFGYIEVGEDIGGAYRTASFHEKPDKQTAVSYLKQGNYFWNSGMYAFRLDVFWQELTAYAPQVMAGCGSLPEMMAGFSGLPSISIDCAVAEKSKRGVTIPLSLYWNDVGSWDAIYEVLDKDAAGNAIKGDVVTMDCKDSLIFGQSRLIAGIGLQDVMVVETDDVILVAQKGESQKVKRLVEMLAARGRREVREHTTLYYAWGAEKRLGEGSGYRLKRLVVRPGKGLEARFHYHRSVHWVVTKGTAEVTVAGTKKMLHDNESLYIPRTTWYSLQNPGRIPLVLIEVENGDYLEDDDVLKK
jgi:mannose-1-phosphate guanylyltransferase/mannose-6-phosphate isomerase